MRKEKVFFKEFNAVTTSLSIKICWLHTNIASNSNSFNYLQIVEMHNLDAYYVHTMIY